MAIKLLSHPLNTPNNASTLLQIFGVEDADGFEIWSRTEDSLGNVSLASRIGTAKYRLPVTVSFPPAAAYHGDPRYSVRLLAYNGRQFWNISNQLDISLSNFKTSYSKVGLPVNGVEVVDSVLPTKLNTTTYFGFENGNGGAYGVLAKGAERSLYGQLQCEINELRPYGVTQGNAHGVAVTIAPALVLSTTLSCRHCRTNPLLTTLGSLGRAYKLNWITPSDIASRLLDEGVHFYNLPPQLTPDTVPIPDGCQKFVGAPTALLVAAYTTSSPLSTGTAVRPTTDLRPIIGGREVAIGADSPVIATHDGTTALRLSRLGVLTNLTNPDDILLLPPVGSESNTTLRSYNGVVLQGLAGGAIDAGDTVYLDSSGELVNGGGTSVGVSLGNYSAGDTVSYVFKGVVSAKSSAPMPVTGTSILTQTQSNTQLRRLHA